MVCSEGTADAVEEWSSQSSQRHVRLGASLRRMACIDAAIVAVN